MASLVARVCSRSSLNIARRVPAIIGLRGYADAPYINPHKGKVVSPERSMADDMGQAVGPMRYEMLANLANINDPFEMQAQPRAKGTLEEPTLVTSQYGERIVGCICEEDALSISWMTLHQGEAKRCMCGYWFKLVKVEPKDFGQV